MASAIIDDVMVCALVMARLAAAADATTRVYAPEEAFDEDAAALTSVRLETMALDSDHRIGGAETGGADADTAEIMLRGSAIAPAAVTAAKGGYAVAAAVAKVRGALRGNVERDATTGHVVELETFSVTYLAPQTIEVQGQSPTLVRMAEWECRGRVTRNSGTSTNDVTE